MERELEEYLRCGLCTPARRYRRLPDAAQNNTIHGSKAVGEPPLMLAIAAREAIRDAVASFAPASTTQIPLPSPATHEAIYATIRRVGGT